MTDSRLRDYQIEMIEAIVARWQNERATLAVSATGTGKTIVFLALLERLRTDGMRRALVLVHKIDLTTQPLARAAEYFPALRRDMGIVQGPRNDVAARVIVSTVQSLTPARLDLIRANGPISHIVVDEAHHSIAPSFARVIDLFPEARVVGFTATPIRADGRGLRGIYQSVAYRMPIRRAIAAGALVPPRVVGIGVPASTAGSISIAWEAGNFLDLVIEKWREYCLDRPTVAFTSTVEQARQTAEAFRAAGIAAEFVSGETRIADREATVARLRSGETRVVANAMVWTEGTDIPEVAGMLILRQYAPQDGPFIQMIGRGLRPSAGKSECVILDFNPRSARALNLEGDLLGDAYELSVREAEAAADEEERLERLAEDIGQLAIGFDVDPARLTDLVLDYLKFDALDWHSRDDCYFMASIGRDRAVWIVAPDRARIAKAESLRASAADWTPAHERAYEFVRRFRVFDARIGYDAADVALVGVFDSFARAKEAADEFAVPLLDRTLADRGAKWRTDPASDAQLRVLRGLGRRSREEISKGAASREISYRKAFRSVEAADRRAASAYVADAVAAAIAPVVSVGDDRDLVPAR